MFFSLFGGAKKIPKREETFAGKDKLSDLHWARPQGNSAPWGALWRGELSTALIARAGRLPGTRNLRS